MKDLRANETSIVAEKFHNLYGSGDFSRNYLPMSRRRPKVFPPGTFIPMPQRLMAIAQLCIAFSLLLWHATQPFMGEYFALRSRMLLYEYAMGTSTFLKSQPGRDAKLEERARRFAHLPEKEMLRSDYQRIQDYAQRPALRKLEEGFRGLIQNVPPFEQAWIFFSIVISILILLKRDGARQAAWLLPLIVLAYAADNVATGKPAAAQPDAGLFPTEELIIQKYLKEPLKSAPQIQKEQLEKGWKQYLIENWSLKSSEDETQKLEDAEYHFTIARLHLLHQQPLSEWLHSYQEKSSGLTLLMYLIWNGMFAWIVSRPVKHQRGNFHFSCASCPLENT